MESIAAEKKELITRPSPEDYIIKASETAYTLNRMLKHLQVELKSCNEFYNKCGLDNDYIKNCEADPQRIINNLNDIIRELNLIGEFADKYADLIKLDIKRSGYLELLYNKQGGF